MIATQVEQKVSYLSTMDVFRDLSQDDLLMMERQVTMGSCKPGKIFYMPEDTGQVLFLLKKGRVQLYCISPSGKKLIVSVDCGSSLVLTTTATQCEAHVLLKSVHRTHVFDICSK